MPSLVRVVGLAVLACGVAIGSLMTWQPERDVFRAGPYFVLAADFHVHSFPGDGGVSPWVMREEARRAGLDVIAVTNHNQPYTGRLAQWVSRRSAGPMMIAGEEVTAGDYHLIAVGVTTRVHADPSAARAIDAIHAQGGVAIAAHPIRAFHGWTDEAVAKLDGAEVSHPVIWDGGRRRQELVAFQERARKLHPGVSPIGSSDVHMTLSLGVCRTFVFVREISETAVLDALRTGMTVAMDMTGQLYGQPSLVAMLRERKPAGRTDGHPGVRRASTALVFMGLLGVLLLGPRRS
jgi:hypothetical protein